MQIERIKNSVFHSLLRTFLAFQILIFSTLLFPNLKII